MFGSQISLGHAPPPQSPPRGRRRSPLDVYHSALGADFSEREPPAGMAREAKTSEAPASLARHVARDAADSVLKTVRAKLRFLGCRGIAGIAKKFRIMDDDGSGAIEPPEFHKAMAEAGLRLAAADVDALFATFDANGDGAISYDEFLAAVRGPMNQRRLEWGAAWSFRTSVSFDSTL